MRIRPYGGVGTVGAMALASILWLGAVSPALGHCGDGVVDAEEGEECDDGSFCTGGDPDRLGQPCAETADCGALAVEGDCRPTGGDGCASNCTIEELRTIELDPDQSSARLQGRLIGLPLNLTGTVVLRTGKPNPDGSIPVVFRADEISFGAIPVPGILCACPKGIEFPQFGPGNGAEGTIACGEATIEGIDYVSSQDHNIDIGDPDECAAAGGSFEEGPEATHPGVCNGPITLEFSGVGTNGAAILNGGLAIGTVMDGGACAGGPDGIPCTEDDGIEVAAGRIIDADNTPGGILEEGSTFCPGGCRNTTVAGSPVSCTALQENPEGGLEGVALAGAFPALDLLGDFVVTTKFVAKAAAPACAGDCNGDGSVGINELISGVRIATGEASVDSCPAMDADGDGAVAINELIGAVRNALNGCPS